MHDRNGPPEHIQRTADRSLRHLGTDETDLYYLHRADLAVPIEDTAGAFRYLVLPAAGIDPRLPERPRRSAEPTPCTRSRRCSPSSRSSRGTRSSTRRKATMDELGIGFVAFSPLGRGALTEGVRSLDDLSPDDARRGLPRFQPDAFDANRRLVARVEAIAAERGATVAQVALAWLLAEGAVPIPGTRRRSRLDENAAAADIVLTVDERQRLADAVPVAEVVGSRDGVNAAAGTDR